MRTAPARTSTVASWVRPSLLMAALLFLSFTALMWLAIDGPSSEESHASVMLLQQVLLRESGAAIADTSTAAQVGSPVKLDRGKAPLTPTPAPSASAPPAPSVAAPSPAPRGTTALDLLPVYHPLFPYKSTETFLVVLGSTWFTGEMPYFVGPHKCPVSNCSINMRHEFYTPDSEARRQAHVVLYHMGPQDYYGTPAQIQYPHQEGKQIVAMMAAEGFQLAEQPPELFGRFNNEFGMRPEGFSRDSYLLWMVNDAEKQGCGPQQPIRLDAHVWQDVWAEPLPWAARETTAVATWASHYCSNSRSNREDLVRDMLALGLNISIFGDTGNCLRNVNETWLNAERLDQFAYMRRHKFHMAFENHRIPGYVSEKFYWSLLRGQVPVVWGAQDIERYAPGPGSYIDASHYNSTAELVQYLQYLSRNEAAYNQYHAWRTSRSFAEYGDILRADVLELIWVANTTMKPVDWYNCRMCHALERVKAEGGFDRAWPMGIKSIVESQGYPYMRQVPDPTPTPTPAAQPNPLALQQNQAEIRAQAHAQAQQAMGLDQ